MKKLVMAAALFGAIAAGSSASAQIKDGQKWADERWMAYDASLSGTTVTLEGYTYGGEEFDPITLTKTGEGKYTVSGDSQIKKAAYKKVKIGDSYTGLLLMYNDKGELAKILFQGCSLSAKANDITIQMLQGEYTDQQGNKVLIDGTEITIGPKRLPMIFADKEYLPQIFKTGDKTCEPEFSLEGAKIYTVKFDHESAITTSRDKLWLTLKRSDAKPMYGFLSEDIILDVPDEFSKRDLRIMRNEIYARHGWTFSSADLKEYFSKKPWYKPLGDNNSIKLNEIETINVERIKYWENHK